MRPVVGVSCYLEPARWGAWDQPAVLLHEQYVTALRDAGAAVVVLPPHGGAEAVARLDGLVLAGGADVDPRRYGALPHPTTDTPRSDRDGSELALYAAARERRIPVLGICRGLQVMAVAEGGALLQDLPSAGSGALHRTAPGTFTRHRATFTDGSLVARALATTGTTVNSSHHQAVADPGALTVTGWAEDGTIEVCEDPSAGFVLGVQWHPEMTEPDAPDRALFTALVHATGAGRSGSEAAYSGVT